MLLSQWENLISTNNSRSKNQGMGVVSLLESPCVPWIWDSARMLHLSSTRDIRGKTLPFQPATVSSRFYSQKRVAVRGKVMPHNNNNFSTFSMGRGPILMAVARAARAPQISLDEVYAHEAKGSEARPLERRPLHPRLRAQLKADAGREQLGCSSR